MKTHNSLLATLTACLLFAFSAQGFAATLLDLDFDTNTGTWSDHNNSTASSVQTDEGNLFGAGDENKYLKLYDTQSGNARGASLAFASENIALTMTLDLYLETATNSSGVFSLASNESGALNAAAPGQVATIALSNFTLETLYALTLYYNDSGSEVSYFNPISGATNALAAKESIAFAYNVSAGSWIEITTFQNSTDSIARIAYYESGTGKSDLFIDNLKVMEGIIAIPEPSTYAFAGVMGMLAVGIAIRRRLKK